MKKIVLFALAIACCVSAFAQTREIPRDKNTDKIKFQQVINVKGSQKEIYERLHKQWLNAAFKNPSAVVTSDKDNVIEGKYTIYIDCNDAVKSKCPVVNYNFTIEAREGRLRYTVTELTLKNSRSLFPIERWLDPADPQYEAAWGGYLDQIAEYVEQRAALLEEKVQPEKVIVEEEW